MGDSHPGRPDGAGPDTGRTGPTDEERAAAADVLRMIWGIHISRAIYVAAELGLADLMADGILANVLHDWDDARAIEILGNCRRVMAGDGRRWPEMAGYLSLSA